MNRDESNALWGRIGVLRHELDLDTLELVAACCEMIREDVGEAGALIKAGLYEPSGATTLAQRAADLEQLAGSVSEIAARLRARVRGTG